SCGQADHASVREPAVGTWSARRRGERGGMRAPVELPASAAEKIAALEVARMQAEDGMHGAQTRLNCLPVDAVQMRERLQRERDKHASRHRAISGLIPRLNQFRMELPLNVVLETAPPVDVKLKPTEKLVDVIESTRSEIKALQQRLAAVRTAPLP